MDYEKAIADFRAAMEAAGLVTADEIVADGKIHRFHAEGDTRGKENGWYVLHVDEHPAGRFGSWRTGQSDKWMAQDSRKLTGAERKELEKRVNEQKRQREKEQAEAAARAKEIWDSSIQASQHHYLQRKGILPFGVRTSRGQLVVPLRAVDGRLHSLQFIDTDGSKRFLAGGRIEGCYTTIAKSGSKLETICICEGFATGASIHQATELPVAVAFNAGNLEPVAKALRSKYHDALIVLCADNDQWTDRPVKNPGVHYSKFAAEQIRGVIAIPEFRPENLEHRPTDFNDLAIAEGLPRVAELVEAVINTQQNAVLPQEAQVGGHSPVAVGINAYLPSGRQFKFHIGDWPIVRGKGGKPVSCIENVLHLLRENQIRVQYDVIRKDLDLLIPGEDYLIDTEKNDKMTRILSVCSMAGLSKSLVKEFVAHIASQNPYNPVAEWVTSKPWDGQSRLADFYETVVAKGEDKDERVRLFKEVLLKRWMISAIAAAFRPDGVSAHGILVFRGDQYLGKTNWFKHLVPPELKLTRDGMLLDPKDKDSVYQIVANWIVELGELDATFRKADVAQLKSFITKDQDTIRLPYAHFPATFARRTVFFGSVNDEEYLSDPTGNRRFWTIDCSYLNHDHSLNMQQIWAEYHALYKAGEGWYLTPEEMALLNAHNKNFEVVTPVEELVRARYPWGSSNPKWRLVTAAEIAQELGFKSPTVRETRAIGKALREITGSDPSAYGGKRVFRVPEFPSAQQGFSYPYND